MEKEDRAAMAQYYRGVVQYYLVLGVCDNVLLCCLVASYMKMTCIHQTGRAHMSNIPQ